MRHIQNSTMDAMDFKENAAREQLVMKHLSQVRHIAQALSAKLPLHVDFDDLLSAGAVGLLDAVEKFDASRDVKFRTYAELRIRGAMLDSLRHLDWAPRSLRRKSRHLERVSKELQRKLGRPASHNEVCFEMKISLEQYHALIQQLQGVNHAGLEGFGFSDNGTGRTAKAEYVCDTTVPDPFFAFQRTETRASVVGAIVSLPKKERLVILLYYFDELPMKLISRVMGLTVSSVSFIHTRALIRLRSRLKRVMEVESN